MKVLGVHWGMCSTAALAVDGRIVSAASEERFTRLKNDDRFPCHAIEYCLSAAGIRATDLDGAALATLTMSYDEAIVHKYCSFSVDDYVREQHAYWRPKLVEKRKVDYLTVFRDKSDRSQFPANYWPDGVERPADFNGDRERILRSYLKTPDLSVQRMDHHRCHAAYAFGASPFVGETLLIVTVDAHGDGLNATISVADESGRVRRVWETDACAIGRIYRHMTLMLGMKPNEHEYKVMGLAPYAKSAGLEKAYELFASTLYVEGLEFKWRARPADLYFWFKDRLEGCRFDGIAGGLQRWVEELLTKWVRNAIEQFQLRTVVVSGGVAMNAKAMGRIAALPQIERFFVPGTGSDESLALGAALCLINDLGGGTACAAVRGVETLLLGPAPTELEEEEVVRLARASNTFEVIREPAAELIAELLDNGGGDGRVIARCAGQMEFGARALGNRSILADPANPTIVAKINQAIKNRDFWMPFAPAVLDLYAVKYLVNPNEVDSPHMTIIYETTKEGWQSMPAACHPADHSARAQIVRAREYPELHRLLAAFAERTGRGALLNTSFNLHGSPIVNTPMDAWDTFNRSSLDGLLLGSWLILKPEVSR